MARAFSKMAEKSCMDALAGRPSHCLKNKINVNRAAHNVGIGSHGHHILQDGAEVPLPKE